MEIAAIPTPICMDLIRKRIGIFRDFFERESDHIIQNEFLRSMETGVQTVSTRPGHQI
jgi:hypothetical protein